MTEQSDPLSDVAKLIIDGHYSGVDDATLARVAREQLLKIWPDGENCQHAHARQCFKMLAELERRGLGPAVW